MAFMLPTPDQPKDERAATTASPQADPAPSPNQARHPKSHRPLEPIGPEKLRRLRESILNGTYPLDEAVVGGLAKMFLGPTGRRDRPAR